MSTALVSVKDATHPFNGSSALNNNASNPPADLILRSTDGIDFHCDQATLAAQSVVFRDMLIFTGKNDERDGKPILPVLETSLILRILLLCVYSPPTAAELMCMPYLEATLLFTNPLWPYVRGTLRDNRKLAAKAAHYTLDNDVPTAFPGVIPDVEAVDPDSLSKLRDFHAACTRDAQYYVGLTQDSIHQSSMPHIEYFPELFFQRSGEEGPLFIWRQLDGHADGCGPYWRDSMLDDLAWEIYPPQWFQDHVAHIGAQLGVNPGWKTAFMAAMSLSPAGKRAISGCTACAKTAPLDLVHYAAQLAVLVNNSNIDTMNTFWKCDVEMDSDELEKALMACIDSVIKKASEACSSSAA
ncbi:hypothetical protein C8R43DRAFT_1121206 [Mycena crocata]|nr:hypothetical protein C8R43DRAFT_1121206 [Mycena crocata]